MSVLSGAGSVTVVKKNVFSSANGSLLQLDFATSESRILPLWAEGSCVM